MKRFAFHFIVLTLCGLPIVSAQAEPTAQGIVPHRAIYSIGLLEATMGDITEVGGAMVVDIAKSCNDWTALTELHMTMGNPDNPTLTVMVKSSDIETLDGREFRFDTETHVNGALQERSIGQASLTAAGDGEAQFESPQPAKTHLPTGTLFPMAAFQHNVQAVWAENKRLNTYYYFDGSSIDPSRVTDIVAGTPEPLNPSLIDPDGLTKGAARAEMRRVVSTIFDLAKTDSEPQTTYVGDSLPNGVLTRLTIDFGFMVAEARLVEVHASTAPTCSE